MPSDLLPTIEIDNFLNTRVVRLATKLQRLMLRKVLREAQVPILEWRVMMAVAQFGPCHMRLITKHNGLDPAHVSRTATALVSKALITRHDDPADQRRKQLSLTPAGEALITALWTDAQTLSDELRVAFTPDEFETFKMLLDRAHAQADALLDSSEETIAAQ